MKLKISNVLDVSKYLSTNVGQEIKGFIEHVAYLTEQTVTALTSNLSYPDNFLCEVKNVYVRSGVSEIIRTSKKQRVTEVRVRRIYSDTYFIVESQGWKYDDSGNLLFNVSLVGSPTTPISMDIIIFY